MKNKTEIMLIREGGIVAAITNDIVTFGLLALAFWFNQEFVGGSNWFSAIIAFCFFISVISAGAGKKRSFGSIQEAIDHLKSLQKGKGK